MKPPDACRYLQNKAYFIPPAPAGETVDEPRPLSTPFWCLKTHDPVGPDGGEVDAECCGPGRSCYKAEVEL